MADDNLQRCNVLGKFFERVNSGIEWGIKHLKFPCPPKRKKLEPQKEKEHVEESTVKADIKKDSCPPSPCPKDPPYLHPNEICPYRDVPKCCLIKMQNPCAPCCCEEKKLAPVCPPKCYPTEPRASTCGCDYCKKSVGNGKCCGQREFLRGIGKDSDRFHNV